MKGIDLKKKLGPLPVWGWALGGLGTIGVIYYLHKSSSSSTTTAAQQSAADLAAQQAAQDAAAGTFGGGGDSGGVGSPVDTTGLATGTTSTDQLETDLQTLQQELAAISAQAPQTVTPAGTITSEAQDLLAAQQALQALGLGGTVTPTTGGTATAKGKATGLPILAQLEDLKTGLLTKSQLGPNAAAQLKAASGNVAKAITARQAAAVGAAPAPKANAATITTAQANTMYQAVVANGGVNAIIKNPTIAQKITVAPKLPKGYQGGL